MRLLHLESCEHGQGSQAFVGFIRAEPEAVMGKRPRSWANSSEETGDIRLPNAGGGKPCLGTGTSHLHSLVAKY